MQQHINTYGGLNQDTAYDSIPSQQYIDAKDIRITTSNGESNGAFTNLEGNSRSFTIDQTGATGVKEIIGVCTIRNVIILFCADTTDTNGWIYFVKYDEKTREITTGPTLVYDGNGSPGELKFSKNNPIEAVGRFETGSIQRIYWTDYNQPLRSLEIADAINSGTAITTDPGLIDIFPNVDYTQPLVTTIGGGGSLFVGQYQFAYRLQTSDGKQTLISPPGVLTHITTELENLPRTIEYMGDPKDTLTSKSIEVTIDTTNYVNTYETIELIVLFFNEYSGTPEISSVESKVIGGNSTTFLYTGLETETTAISSIEFGIKTYPFSTVKTLVPKDNSLVVANIKQNQFSISDLLAGGETFSALTKRYDSTPLPPTGTDLVQAFNTEYNRDAHWDPAWHTGEQYKFKANGTTLGGEGPNISYKFTVHPFVIDSNKQFPPTAEGEGVAVLPNLAPNADVNLGDGYTHKSKSFLSLASPYLSAL